MCCLRAHGAAQHRADVAQGVQCVQATCKRGHLVLGSDLNAFRWPVAPMLDESSSAAMLSAVSRPNVLWTLRALVQIWTGPSEKPACLN